MTTMLGVTRPGVAPLFPLRRKSNLLFHLRAADLLLGHDPSEEVAQAVTGEAATFTRTTAGGLTRGRDGVLMQWPLDVPRLEMFDLDADDVFETPGLLLEGQRTNVILRSEEIDNAAWNDGGTPIVTANDIEAPDGETTAEKIEDDNGASAEHRRQDVVVANDSTTWAGSVFVKKALTGAAVVVLRVELNGGTSKRAELFVDPILGTSIANADVVNSTVEDYGDWWRVWLSVANNSSGNTSLRFALFPAGRPTGDIAAAVLVNSATGTNHFWGAQGENANFLSSYIKTVGSSVVRNADALTYTLLWLGDAITEALDDLTVYARLPRPLHADATGTLPLAGITQIANPGTFARIRFNDSTRQIAASILGDNGAEESVVVNIPAGNVIEFVTQIANIRTGGTVRTDVGGGFTSLSTAADPGAAWGNQVLDVGQIQGATRRLFGAIIELKIARGLRTFKQMQEAA